MKTPTKFQYPGFETVNWFAAKKLLKELKELNNEEKKCPPYFLQGVRALLSILKQWNTDKDVRKIFLYIYFFVESKQTKKKEAITSRFLTDLI